MIDVTDDVLVFKGSGKLLDLITRAIHRPPRGEAPGQERRRGVPLGPQGLPVICAVGDAEPQALARGIGRFLRAAGPHRVPYAALSFPQASQAVHEDSPEAVRAALHLLARDLSSGRNGPGGRVRFRRFGLVNWLLQQGGEQPGADRLSGEAEAQDDRLLAAALRERDVRRRGLFGMLRAPETELALEGRAPWWVWLMLRLLPIAWFRVRRGLGAEYRWLLRQPYLAPRDPGTFIGFAERLTAPHHGEEDQTQLIKLMVNAFLEDLRAAYAHRTWRPRAARRTTYCAALLVGAGPRNAGHRLIRTIIEVRADTGAFDPLLVIACGAEPPQVGPVSLADFGDRALWELGDGLYDGWRDAFLRKARNRTPAAWYLPVGVPALLAPEDPRYETVRRRERVADLRLTPHRAPRWARRGRLVSAVCGALVLVIAAGLFQWGPWSEADWRQAHCGLPRSRPDAATLHTSPDGKGCIGVAPYGFSFGAEDRGLRTVLRTIADQNRQAEKTHHDHPRRPLITLIRISGLFDGSDNSTTRLTNIREQLQGAAEAQKYQLEFENATAPVLRLFPANAGARMSYGEETVGIIRQMMHDDPSIMGVTGLDQSFTGTRDTIEALTTTGLPSVGTVLSADSLAELSPLYFQVSPQNKREAQVAAAYADELTAHRKVRILSSADPDDTYSMNLGQDAAVAFKAAQYQVTSDTYTPTAGADGRRSPSRRTARELGSGSCRFPGLVFFAGRSDDFEAALGGIHDTCGDRPPVILGNDSVSLVATERLKRYQVPYDFLDFTYHGPDSALQDSLTHGHAALDYDAVMLYVLAVQQLQDAGVPLNGLALWHALTTVRGEQKLTGKSGEINFGGYDSGHVPLDKLISVQHVDRRGRLAQVAFCGRYDDRTAARWCPAPEAARPITPADGIGPQADRAGAQDHS